jgi:hypothetical protein
VIGRARWSIPPHPKTSALQHTGGLLRPLFKVVERLKAYSAGVRIGGGAGSTGVSSERFCVQE